MSMNYAIEQRLRFIDFLVSQYGNINRSALVEYFGISRPCATKDLTMYKKLHKGNITYDEVSKSYIKAPNFKRVYT